MPGRGDEAEAEPLEVIEGVAEGVNLQFTSVAGARIDMPDGETSSEGLLGRLLGLQ